MLQFEVKMYLPFYEKGLFVGIFPKKVQTLFLYFCNIDDAYHTRRFSSMKVNLGRRKSTTQFLLHNEKCVMKNESSY